MTNNNESTNNINPPSNPHRRTNFEPLSTENRYNNNNTLKTTGKELHSFIQQHLLLKTHNQ